MKDPVVVKTYTAKNQAEAAKLFAEDAVQMGREGYEPISQSWADGKPGIGRVLMLGLFSAIMKPDGDLTVTYRLRP
jgi:hypothetical protein